MNIYGVRMHSDFTFMQLPKFQVKCIYVFYYECTYNFLIHGTNADKNFKKLDSRQVKDRRQDESKECLIFKGLC